MRSAPLLFGDANPLSIYKDAVSSLVFPLYHLSQLRHSKKMSRLHLEEEEASSCVPLLVGNSCTNKIRDTHTHTHAQ